MILDGESNWVHGVMRNREALDAQIAELEAAARLHELPARFALGDESSCNDFLRERRAEERNCPVPAQDINPTGMITVLVAQEDAVHVFNSGADHLQAGNDLAGAESGVNEKRRLSRGYHGAVARTPAAKNRQS